MIGRTRLALLLVILATGFAVAKTPDSAPKWMDAEMREKLYPASSYYTGFAIAELEKGKSLEETFDRLKQTASGDIMASIRVLVQRVATDSMRNVVSGGVARSSNVFTSVSKLTTGNVEIPGIQTETYYDEGRKVAAAFAYVHISGLVPKLQRQLMMQISKLEIRNEETSDFLASDNRTKARESHKAARVLLSQIEDMRLTMLAIDGTLNDDDLMTSEWKNESRKMAELEKQLNEFTKIYFTCTASNTDFGDMVRSGLSKLGSIFLDEQEEADWTISIDAKVTPYNAVEQGEYTFYYSNASAKVTIKNKKGEVIHSGYEKAKGGHTLGYDKASEKAYQELAAQLSNLLINKIQQ